MVTLRQVLLVFFGGAGGGAHHVAEIVERQARHHGVEVDDADAFAGCVVEHHVVELGVVVRDALGQVCLEQNAGDRFAREGEFDLRPGQDGAALTSEAIACSNAAKRLGVW